MYSNRKSLLLCMLGENGMRGWGRAILLACLCGGPMAGQVNEAKPEHPAVNPGRPTLTDPASLTAPGWLEAEFGLQRALQGSMQLTTPLLLKLTGGNNRLEYRLATDGYNRQRSDMGGHPDGLGDTYAALHCLLTRQGPHSWDTAARVTVKIPTASGRRGVGSGRTDYSLLLLASRDFTPMFHVDANLGWSMLGRQAIGGFDHQVFASLSTTAPLPHSRWSYTNEIAWFSAIPGQGDQLTTMHGFSYAARPWEVWDIAANYGLSRGAPRWQVLVGRTFFLGRLF
jgi:hypothetical protein